MTAAMAFLILAFACSLLATFGASVPRVNLVAAALTFYFAWLLLPAFHGR